MEPYIFDKISLKTLALVAFKFIGYYQYYYYYLIVASLAPFAMEVFATVTAEL